MTRDNLLTDDEFTELIDMAKSKNKYTSVSIKNPVLGEIILPHGMINKEKTTGYGYEHIVYGRLFKDNLNKDEIANLIIRTLEIIKSATQKDIKSALLENRIVVEKENIKVVLSQEKFCGKDLWVLTSYPLFEENVKTIKKEALDFLSTVNATKEYAQYYSSFRDIVGALTSRFIISKNSQNVNGGQEI